MKGTRTLEWPSYGGKGCPSARGVPALPGKAKLSLDLVHQHCAHQHVHCCKLLGVALALLHLGMQVAVGAAQAHLQYPDCARRGGSAPSHQARPQVQHNVRVALRRGHLCGHAPHRGLQHAHQQAVQKRVVGRLPGGGG